MDHSDQHNTMNDSVEMQYAANEADESMISPPMSPLEGQEAFIAPLVPQETPL